MKSFEDRNGQTWNLEITVGSLKRVRDLAGVNLADLGEGEVLERLGRDPVLLGDVLFALCKLQADERGVGDEQFGAALAGDAVEQATTALLEELADFFPSRRRTLLRKALAKMKRIEDLAIDAAEARLDADEMEKEALAGSQASGSESGSSPESSESIPGR